MRRTLLFLVLFWIGTGVVLSQSTTKRQQELEAQRVRLKNEIKQINELLFSSKKTGKNVVTEVEDLQVKLSVREELIKVTNAQVNLLTRKLTLTKGTSVISEKNWKHLKRITPK